MTLPILFHADGLVVVNKPPGLLVIPGRSEADRRCARDVLAEQLGSRVWVCHRLDRDTSGAIVFALDAERHRTVSMAFEHDQVKKTYLALVEGHLTAPVDIDVPLIAGRKNTMRPAKPSEQGKPAFTQVRPVRQLESATLVECQPTTGRQHQLRVHLRSIGHPLLVDPLYGKKPPVHGLTRTPLHAWKLELLGLSFEAPVPPDLNLV